MTPRELVELWVQAFNRAEPDALAGFYTEDAVNHQVAEAPIHGKHAIREMFATGFASATMVCIIENIFQAGYEVQTHKHTGPVWGYTTSGAWKYKEYDYVKAEEKTDKKLDTKTDTKTDTK